MLKVYYLITFLINYLVPLVLKFRLLKKKEDPDRYKEKLGKYIKNMPISVNGAINKKNILLSGLFFLELTVSCQKFQ